MSAKTDPHHSSTSCVLFQTADSSAVLIDVPRSIEEAQLLPGHVIRRRITSSSPIETPWETPEPKKKNLGQPISPSAAIAELMTQESVKFALREIKHSYKGPWCLPRILRDVGKASNDKPKLDESHEGKRIPLDSGIADPVPEPFIPDQSRYLLGTVESRREAFLADAPMFDLIVLDPPWPSRSVKRKKNSYAIAHDIHEVRDLLTQIPVASHLKSDGVVAIWVTNKAAIIDLLTSSNGVFSEWGLEPVGEWTWLKITSAGDPIVDVESQWRKPWERLLLGRKRGSTVKAPVSSKVIIGVPDVHSRKPNLRPLFRDLLPENYSGLEVFARNLTAGWWSWGNEVLYFQQRHHWVETTGGG